jgi:diaminopimelate decarboxylase
MTIKLLISGLYSGPSPSAGIGVARSIRESYPQIKIIGMDYWAGSSGLHHEVFDETVVHPSWDLMDLDTHKAFVQSFLNEGGYYIPTLDLETVWLAKNIGTHPRLLSPSSLSLKAAGKPFASVTDFLPFGVPETLTINCHETEIHDFCRRSAWRLWLKGPYHDASFINNWQTFSTQRSHLSKKWSSDKLFLQAHKKGVEESICFAANGGELLEAVYMRKRVTTPDGKTWSGKIEPLESKLRSHLATAVKNINWSGGAEIELLRDSDNNLWFMEMNPRFPAWIYGAAIAGINLPAVLFKSFSGLQMEVPFSVRSNQFTRVVLEIPVLEHTPLPLVSEPLHGQISMSGKYGAGMASLVDIIESDNVSKESEFIPASKENDDLLLISDVEPYLQLDTSDARPTPERLVLPRILQKNFASISSLLDQNSTTGFAAGYSIKTNPDEIFCKAARKAGMLGECISMLEVKRAIESGWEKSEVILNGPAKWWPMSMHAFDGLYAVFADSIEEFKRLTQSNRTDAVWGLRLKIPGFNSRFGVDIDTQKKFNDVCQAVSELPSDRKFGVHLHLASNLIGNSHWQDAVESMLVWALNIEAATGKKVSVIDMGGGYHPRDLFTLPWPEIVAFIRQGLKHVERIIIEPGRAMTQDAMALVTTIVDVRRTNDFAHEIVVDTCIAELPLINVYPHRFFLQKKGQELIKIGKGKTRVLGRICMEDDIISGGLDLPTNIAIGDRIIIGDAGAYERSMSYEFGRGGY